MMNQGNPDQLKDKVIVGGFGAVTEKFSALANPTRRAIIYLLAIEGPLTLKEISEKLGLSPSTVSDHLKRLKSIGVITEAREQPKRFKVEIYYKLAVPYFLIGELNRLKDEISDLLNRYKLFINEVNNQLKTVIKKSDIKCLRNNISSERISMALTIGLGYAILSEIFKEPIIYFIINDQND